MLRKITLLSALLIIFASIVAFNPQTSESFLSLFRQPAPVEVAKIPYTGPTKILSVEVLSLGYWGAEIELKYHASRVMFETLFAESKIAGHVPRSQACGGLVPNIRKSYLNQPNVISVWLPRPSTLERSITTKEIHFYSARGCDDPITQKIFNSPAPTKTQIGSIAIDINWPTILSTDMQLESDSLIEIDELPKILLGTNVQNVQEIATKLVSMGYPKNNIGFFNSYSHPILDVQIYHQVPASVLAPIFKELASYGHTFNMRTSSPNTSINSPTVSIGNMRSQNAKALSRAVVQRMLDEQLSNEEFYSLADAKWIDPEQKAQDLVSQAKSLIDSGSVRSIRRAKGMLDEALTLYTDFPELYIELSRYNMKMNQDFNELSPSATGKYVSDLLSKSLESHPNHANTLILLGYVQTTQNEFETAEIYFQKAADLESDNWWLWNNWALLHTKRGEIESAIQKYMKVADRDSFSEANRAAFSDSIREITKLLIAEEKFEIADKYYDKHYRLVSGLGNCLPLRHSLMLTQNTYQFDRAIQLAQIATNNNCAAQTALAMALYSKWFSIRALDDTDNAAWYARAKASSPNTAKVYYELARYKLGLEILGALVSAGEDIDSEWNGETALLHAISSNDSVAVFALLSFGANANFQPQGAYMNPLSLAVASANLELIELLMKNGGDPYKADEGQPSAIDIARQLGSAEIIYLLSENEI